MKEACHVCGSIFNDMEDDKCLSCGRKKIYLVSTDEKAYSEYRDSYLIQWQNQYFDSLFLAFNPSNNSHITQIKEKLSVLSKVCVDDLLLAKIVKLIRILDLL